MFDFGFNKIYRQYRIARNRKKVLKHKTYFIDQLSEFSTKQQIKRDMKEVFFYPMTLNTNTDIKQNKLILILSSENGFICNGETETVNNKVIEYQLKLKNINDNFYKECYSNNTEYECLAHDVYSEINALLASTKATRNNKFKISPFFNFLHFNMSTDNWKMFECTLATDDFVIVRYKLAKKKHKNYCFNPSLLFGASKEMIQITFNTDDSFYYCEFRIGLIIESTKLSIVTVN